MKGMSYTYIMKKEQAIASYWKAYQLNPANTGAIANFAYLSDRTGMDINQEELTDRDKKRILVCPTFVFAESEGKTGCRTG